MSHMCAEIDENNIVLRVVMGQASFVQPILGGTWIDYIDGVHRIPGPGSHWVDGQFWPWTADNATSSLWVLRAVWDTVPVEDCEAFMDVTRLTPVHENGYIIFGGRTITDEDIVALIEVLP